ncbi:MAG: hypothetical protein ACPF8V_06140 [Luteibaculum sp.]
MRIIIAISLLGSVIGLQPLLAQETEGNLNQEIVTVGERQLKLKDAFKSSFFPMEVDTVITKEDLQYSVAPVFFKTNFEPDTLKAARLKVVEPLDKLYPGYVKLGIGNYTMPFGQIYVGSNRNRNNQFALGFSHLSSNGDQDDPEAFSGPFSRNRLDGWYKNFQRSSAFSTHIWGERNNRTFGIPQTFVEQQVLNDNNRAIGNVGAALNFQTFHKKEEKLNHAEELVIDYTEDNFTSTELNINLGTQLEKYYNTELYKLDLDVQQNIYKLADTSDAQNNTLVRLRPHIYTTTENVQVDLGINVSAYVDRGRSFFYFFPQASITYTGFERFARPYAGIKGDATLNRYKSVMELNPFINPIQNITLQREKLNAYLGMRGKFSERSSYNVKFAYQQMVGAPMYQYVDNTGSFVVPLFKNYYRNNNGFNYINVSYNQLSVLLEYSFELVDKFLGTLSAQYNAYEEFEAINAPIVEINSRFKYNLSDKLLADAQLTYVPERTDATGILDGSVVSRNLGSYIDASLGLEYRYTRRISAFLNFSNIAGNRYLIYPDYAVLGFGVMGGLNYSF